MHYLIFYYFYVALFNVTLPHDFHVALFSVGLFDVPLFYVTLFNVAQLDVTLFVALF